MQRFSVWLLGLLLFAAAPAFADKCIDPIVDETNLLSAADKTQIQSKIDALRTQGAEAHVQLLTSYHRNASDEMMKSLTEYKQFMQAKCSTWKAPDGGFKNNMVLVLVVPKKFSESTKKGAPYALFYGAQWSSKLNPHFNRILDSMEGNFREQKWGAGIVAGLTDVSDLIAVTPSQVGKPIVINHSADYSGVWGSAVSWFFGLIFLALLAFAITYFLRKKGANDTAQRAAQTERGKCSVYENNFETEYAGLKARIASSSVTQEWKTHLFNLLDRAVSQQSFASAQLSGLNRSSNNPDTPRLSQEAYAAMAERYRTVVSGYETANALLKAAAADFEKAKRGEPVTNVVQAAKDDVREEAQTRQQRSRTRQERYPASGSARRPASPSAPAPTTVVHHHHDRGSNDGFLTGVIVGSVMSDHHSHDRDRGGHSSDSPVINFPTAPADQEGGGERTTTSSGDGGGGERIVSFSGDGGGGERNSEPAPAPSESTWTGGGGTSY